MEAGAGHLEITSLMAARSGKKAGGNEARLQTLKVAPGPSSSKLHLSTTSTSSAEY